MPTSSAESSHRPALQVDRISAGYGGAPIIRDVSLAVDREAIAAVIGPNGAGKSTLLKAITGVIQCSSGGVQLDGEDITGLRADEIARKGVGYVPQVRDVFGPLTVKENLEMGGYALARSVRDSRIDEVLSVFPALGEMRDRRAGNLSGGERKMLAIGRVLMTRPTVLILDEPTANLSPKVAHQLLEDHVTGLAKGGVAVVLVEQRALEALSIATWAYVIVAGNVELSASAEAVRNREDIGELFLGRPATVAGLRSSLPQ